MTEGAPLVALPDGNRKVNASVSGGALVIRPPALTPDPFQHLFVFRI